MNDIKSMRFMYEIVMFLCGEPTVDNISQNDMRNMVRIKVGWDMILTTYYLANINYIQ